MAYETSPRDNTSSSSTASTKSLNQRSNCKSAGVSWSASSQPFLLTVLYLPVSLPHLAVLSSQALLLPGQDTVIAAILAAIPRADIVVSVLQLLEEKDELSNGYKFTSSPEYDM